MTDPGEPEKVAVISAAPNLNDSRFYQITYQVDGKPAGRSVARADEIDAWRNDLQAAGYTLQETETSPGT